MTTDWLEPCSTKEVCVSMNGTLELLSELCGKLREWLEHQPHLPQDIPEQRLEFFVISTKHSLELAKQKLDMYYTVRRLVPEIFSERDPLAPAIANLSDSVQMVCLPKLTPNRHRVSIIRSLSEDASIFSPWDLFKYLYMVSDIRLGEDRCLGEILIYDLQAMRLGHLAKITPTMLKKVEVVAMKAYGARIKGIHFINAPSFIDRIVTLVKSTIKPKLAARVHVHSSGLESLYEFVPKSILPVDYGGEQSSMEELDGKLKKKVAEWRDWFIKEEKLVVNEELRPGPTINVDDLFGFHGSFRKLDVD